MSLADAPALFPEGLLGLIFDVDGVLLDSRASNISFYNQVRDALGFPPLSLEEEDYCHMASVEEALARIIPRSRLGEAAEACRRIDYRKRILPLLKPEPGMPEALRWLRRQGVRLAVCTNRSDSVAEVFRYFGLETFFNPVKTVDNSPPKPSPAGLLDVVRAWGVSRRQIAFVGDSSVDMRAAEAGGIPFWAFRNPDLPAQARCADFFALLALAAPLVEGGGLP
ncbi:MAG: HAD family hydrolase [Desulfovibrio sp.]|jgi:HAD superfamily hydrolase (TIGR01509 family)|nr:HAD family hydrolase [Desulfovibrio sp.]